MSLLAIDTSGSVGCVALGGEQGILAEYHFAHNMNLLRRLTPTIENVISDAGLTCQDLTGIVISLGPGSFTGLRIGVTAAKTLAWSLNIPIVGVDTLHAIARPWMLSQYDYTCAMVYSRKGESYWSVMDFKNSEVLIEPSVTDVDSIISYIKELDGSVICCGSGAIKNRDILLCSVNNLSVAPEWTSFARGAALLDIGMERLRLGQTDDPLALTPVYVKKPTPVVRKESASQVHEK